MHSNGDFASYISGTHGDTVDATFKIEKLAVDGIRLAAVVTTTPDAGTSDVKIHTLLERRTALAFRVHRLHVNQRNVRTVSLQTFRPKNRREPQRHGRPDGVLACGNRRLAVFPGNGFAFARLPRDVFKRKEVAVGNFSVAERLSVHEQLHVR